MIILFCIKKPNYNKFTALLFSSVVSVYVVNLNSSLSGALLYKIQYEMEMERNSARLKEYKDKWEKCGCMECIRECFDK